MGCAGGGCLRDGDAVGVSELILVYLPVGAFETAAIMLENPESTALATFMPLGLFVSSSLGMEMVSSLWNPCFFSSST